MEVDTHEDLRVQLHGAVQDLDEVNRRIRQKLAFFAAGMGPYPVPEDWQRRWRLEATIGLLRDELEREVSWAL